MTLLLVLTLLAQDALRDRVKEHAAGLMSEEIEAREVAAKALEDLGEPALAPLKEMMEAESDAEIKAQIAAVLKRIEKAVARAKVYRAPKPVTVTAKERRLEDVVRDACAQAGVPFAVESSVADRPVTLEAGKQPLLQALDALCGDEVTFEVADGKVAFKKGRHPRYPTAYGDGFRVRLKRVSTFETNSFTEASAAVILYFDTDCEPGIAPRGARLLREGLKASAGKTEPSFIPVLEGRSGGSSSSGNRGTLFVEDVPVAWDDQVKLETTCLAKDLPAGVRKFDVLKVKTVFRFAPGTRTATCKAKMNARGSAFEGAPLRVNYYGSHMQIEMTENVPLESVGDPTSIVVVTSDGKEHKSRPLHANARYRMFYIDDLASERGDVEIRMTVFDDVFDREVEFELKDVKLRD